MATLRGVVNGQDKSIKCSIAVDPKFIVNNEIQLSKCVHGDISLAYKRNTLCRAIYICLSGKVRLTLPTYNSYIFQSKRGYKGVAVHFVYREGTPDLSRGTNKLPFVLELPHGLPPSFQNRWAEIHYELRVMIIMKNHTASYLASSVPVNILNDLNVREHPDYRTPLSHVIHGSMSFWEYESKNNEMKLLFEAERSAYASEEELPFTITVLTKENFIKVKNIKVTLMKKLLYSVCDKLNTPDEESDDVISSTIISEFSTPTITGKLLLPKDLKHSFLMDCFLTPKTKWLHISELYRIVVDIEPFGLRSAIKENIPITIGTVNLATSSSLESLDVTLTQHGSSNVWDDTQSLWSAVGTGRPRTPAPAYSSLSVNSDRRRMSSASLQTLPPTFEEALKLSPS